jgi:quinol monooxygenase YgiN
MRCKLFFGVVGQINPKLNARLANRREPRNKSLNFNDWRNVMLVVMGTIRMGEGEIDRLQPDMAAQMAATQAEDGCEQYVFSRDVTDPNTLLISERWRDDDALNAHMKAPHMAIFNKAIGSAAVLGMSVKRYDVASVSQLLGSD